LLLLIVLCFARFSRLASKSLPGFLISAFDEGQSAQQDIIVIDKRIIPLFSSSKDPLTDAELDRLGDFLKSCKGDKAMNAEALDGFFAALITRTGDARHFAALRNPLNFRR
jgi:hypothetical protein